MPMVKGSIAPERDSMAIGNDERGYGWPARMAHWLVAALIFAAIGFGLWAASLPQDSPDQIAAVIGVFSLHKTLGIAALLLAVLRLVWAAGQPKPRRLWPHRRIEAAIATWVNWALYLGMILVPLSGWLRHASIPGGFAPIRWPLGQGLPFVVQDPVLSDRFAAFHVAGWWVLAALIALHVAGALKHALIDRDATMARMFRSPDKLPRPPASPRAMSGLTAALGAGALWLGTAIIALALTLPTPLDAPDRQAVAASPEGSDWAVETGELMIEVQQGATPVQGSFSDWQAAITYDPDTGQGKVTVQIAISSLMLGSISDMAKGPQFLDESDHPQASFTALILPDEGGRHLARGTLTIAGRTIPAELPFDLQILGDEAQAQGQMTVDRRDFGVGEGYPDESNIGFAVAIRFSLTARH